MTYDTKYKPRAYIKLTRAEGEGHLKKPSSHLTAAGWQCQDGLAEHLQTLCSSSREAAEIHWLNWLNSSDEACKGWAEEGWPAGASMNSNHS